MPKRGGLKSAGKRSDILFPYRSPSHRPHHDPTQHPRNGPETDPERTRNGAKRSQKEPNGAEMDRNVGMGRGGGCKGKRISLGKRQESATFLQRSFFNVALQFFACCNAACGQNDIRIADKLMLQCSFCSASFRENCSATSVFACGMLQGWGLEGWGLGLVFFVVFSRFLRHFLGDYLGNSSFSSFSADYEGLEERLVRHNQHLSQKKWEPPFLEPLRFN